MRSDGQADPFKESAVLPSDNTNKHRDTQKQPADVLAGRESSEDRTLAVLLEQAFRIKEEVSSGLQKCEGSAHAHALSHTLLQSHILIITRIVQQLSVSVQILQGQIAERDWVMSGTTQAVQWLDRKNMASIGDLRGRVARCEASLGQLSAEVKSSERHVQRLQQEVNQLRSVVELGIKNVHVKLQRDLGRLEASLAEVYQAQRSFRSEVQSQIGKVENELSEKITQVVKQSSTMKKWTEQQTQHCVQSLEQSQRQLQGNMVKAQRGLLDKLQALEGGLEQLRSQQERAVCSQAERLKNTETGLSNRTEALEKILHHEVQLLKHNYHKGFTSVHDAIETLKEVTDLKSRLEKGKIQKKLNHICEKVAKLSHV
ncbi:protein FAM81B [Periophthalmus magnuspinnatus]|uniref:protein FAM81B n=1 Tax=Periophthalmus magnuspinnatus TaxID=409849 RepID=UPI00145B55CD|nr:protein FAM81B [Periophthalmus magnuspinnatus]